MVDYVRRCLGLAAEIGAPLVQMLASGEPRLTPIASRDQEWAWSVAGMQAADRGLAVIGVGIHNDFGRREECPRASEVVKVKQWVEVAERLGAPMLRVFAGWSGGDRVRALGRHDRRPAGGRDVRGLLEVDPAAR